MSGENEKIKNRGIRKKKKKMGGGETVKYSLIPENFAAMPVMSTKRLFFADFFGTGRFLFFGRNPVNNPIKPKQTRYIWYLNLYNIAAFLYWFRHRYEIYRRYQPV